jgi:hypothetical protein
MKVQPLARDAELFAVEGGTPRLVRRGELSITADGTLFLVSAEQGAAPFSLQLAVAAATPAEADADARGGDAGEDAGVAGSYVCAWVDGSNELLISIPGQPPSYALVILDEGADVTAIAAALEASTLPPAAAIEVPAIVQLAASAIEGTGKVAASVIAGAGSLVGTGMGAMLQTFRTHVRARPPVRARGTRDGRETDVGLGRGCPPAGQLGLPAAETRRAERGEPRLWMWRGESEGGKEGVREGGEGFAPNPSIDQPINPSFNHNHSPTHSLHHSRPHSLTRSRPQRIRTPRSSPTRLTHPSPLARPNTKCKPLIPQTPTRDDHPRRRCPRERSRCA